MKIIHRYLLVLISVLALGSCQKESLPIGNEGTIVTQDISVELGISEEEMRSMTYSGVKVSFPQEDLNVRVAVRLKNSPQTSFAQTLLFKYANGGHSYVGQLKVPAAGLTTTATTSNLEVSAVLLGSATQSYATFSGNSTTIIRPKNAIVGTDTEAIVSLPSYSEWSSLPFGQTGQNKTFRKKTLSFKSGGTLLGLKIKNETDKNQTVRSVKLSSTAVSPEWSFSFGAQDLSKIINVSGDALYNLPAPGVTLTPGQTTSDTYYIWVAPMLNIAQPNTVLSAILSDGKEVKAFVAKSQVRLSSRISATLVLPVNPADNFPGGVVPWETPAPGVLTGEDGTGTITASGTATIHQAQYYDLKATIKLAQRIAGKVQADGLVYYMPTMEQWTRFTPILSSNSDGVDAAYRAKEVVVFADNQPADLSDSKYNYYSIYRYADATKMTLYGLRFIHPVLKTATAFKYEAVEHGTERAKLVISMVYIGDPNKYTIDQIKAPSFDWSQARSIVLPLIGYKNFTPLLQSDGYSVYYWTLPNSSNTRDAYTAQFSPGLTYNFFQANGANSFPLFLFGRKP